MGDDEIIGCIGIGSYMHPEPSPLTIGIGWNRHQFNKGFNKVANIWRYTLKPNAPPLTASRALGILERTAPKDWAEKYESSEDFDRYFNCGDGPVGKNNLTFRCHRDWTRNDLALLVTLVGGGHKGTCFTAANWLYIGNTRGFGGKRKGRRGKIGGLKDSGYLEGKAVAANQKLIFIKPLVKDWRAALYVKRYSPENCGHERVLWFSIGRVVVRECSFCITRDKAIRYDTAKEAQARVRLEMSDLSWKQGRDATIEPWETSY
jgi:hypothetical protein